MSGPEFATLGGFRVVKMDLMIPYFGAWVADVTLFDSLPIQAAPTRIPLVVSNLTLLGTVFRQYNFAGSRSVRLVGGGGGWDSTIPPQAYYSPAGIPLALLLTDAATACGEVMGPASLTSVAGSFVGTSFVREYMPAIRLVRQLAGPVWWVDNAGLTQCVDRALLGASGVLGDATTLGPILTTFVVNKWSGAKGQFTISSEFLADWMPGRMFANELVTTPQTISFVTHSLDNEGIMRTEVLATP